MSVLIAIAVKSLLVAGGALILLHVFRNRSAAERSWIAHIGLIALILLAFAPLALPRWTVEAPVVMGAAPSAPVTTAAAPVRVSPTATVLPEASAGVAQAPPALSSAMVATALYAIPAAILLIMTGLALARLVALRARADVLVDGHWLSALARAQRRMGFKHGTALLTSDDLNSPISWGLMRPVILLNSRAVEASSEAEAIIAHELAHVARMDWMKLLLARVATALFWFNPLVWILAREAHQLREETADDAVLAADIVDTDYAELLVGVARHDCPGLLLGAHGVAPSKKSLSRRIARVLDGASPRGPAARPFALGVLAGAVLVSAPLAALTLIPGGSANGEEAPAMAARQAYASSQPADLGTIIADGVSTSVSSAVAAVAPAKPVAVLTSDPKVQVEGTVAAAINDARQARAVALSHGAAVVAANRNDEDADDEGRHQVDYLALGITPAWAAQIRAAAPSLRNATFADISSFKAVGVTPEYIRSMTAAGFGNLDPEELTEARAVGLTADYMRSIRDAGVRADFDQYVQLRAVGVSPEFVRRIRAAGYSVSDADRVVELYAVGGGAIGPPPTRGRPPSTYDPPDLPRKPGGT